MKHSFLSLEKRAVLSDVIKKLECLQGEETRVCLTMNFNQNKMLFENIVTINFLLFMSQSGICKSMAAIFWQFYHIRNNVHVSKSVM